MLLTELRRLVETATRDSCLEGFEIMALPQRSIGWFILPRCPYLSTSDAANSLAPARLMHRTLLAAHCSFPNQCAFRMLKCLHTGSRAVQ